MSSGAIQRLRTLIKSSSLIKTEALNRDDPRFSPWHDEAREAIVQSAPIKRFAFDEISFASDFFLSKPFSEREDINDRIALVSDFQLASQLLEKAIQISENECSRKKRELLRSQSDRLHEKASASSINLNFEWIGFFDKIEAADFSNREKDEIRTTLKNLQDSLKGTKHDWDRFKRGIKFFLDYDRALALDVIPFLIKTFKSSVESKDD